MKISGIDVGGTAIKYVMTDMSAEISKINDENQEGRWGTLQFTE